MYVVSKWGFQKIPPLTLAFLRIGLGAGTLYLIVRITTPPRTFSRREWWRFTTLAIWLTAALTTQFVGTDLTNASQGSLLTVLTPVFMIFLGREVLGEQLTREKVAGIGLALIGTLVVIVGQYDLSTLTSGNLFGVGLLLSSAFCFAAFSVFGKPLIERYSALETVTYSTVLSVPLFGMLVPVELYVNPTALNSIPMTLPIVGVLLYLGLLSTAAAWYCWYKGMEYADASTVAVFFFAQPVVGILLGAVFLHESVGIETIGGGLLLAIGVYIVDTENQSSEKQPRQKEVPPRGN
ncbi:DMT family transporter [Haladaptatus sp. AB643]|nr:DMT family transporter [Haladaptatus sp. AB643]